MASNLRAAIAIAFLAATAAAADDIALTLTNDLPWARGAEPVTCGVPLAPGFGSAPRDLALLGPEGRAVPCQILATSAHVDGTPRWVLLDFQADLPPNKTATYRLARGRPAAVPAPLAWKIDGADAQIDTGAARIRVGLKTFRLLDSVRVGDVDILADPGALLVRPKEGAAPLGPAEVTSAEFEDAGPMRAVLVIRGRLGPAAKRPLAEFVCRLHFFAGKSEIRVFFTLHNPAAHNHPGNLWDLGSGGSLLLEDVSLVLPLARDARWTSRIGAGAAAPPAAGATKLYQDSSGGPRWNSANHIDGDYEVRTSFRGYRIYDGEGGRSEGERADGWIHARSARGGVAAGVREFWQNFPKALELRDGELRIALWPGEFAGVHEILGGEQKTHEILLVFH
ncbi:MAG: hypothetical protein JXP34_12660, partial [Planctomycetes bacterium]|nr:hypothetical protein [Planctomycetota bacterium]